MNGKTTLWLCATAVALLAFIYLFERRLPSRTGAAPPPTPLLAGFDPRLIESVEFAHSNSLVRAERTNGQWLLTAPVRYPANKVAIENLLSSITLLRRQTILSADEILSRPGAAAEFGIDPPRATLLLRAGRDRKEFLLGSATPPGTHIYYQFIGAPGIFLAPEGFWTHLPASVDDWRDAAFVDLRGARFSRVRIRFADLGFELVRAETNQMWSITDPVASRADDVQVAALLRQIEQLEVRHFVPPPYPRLEPFGLDPPALTVSFGRGTNDLFHVYFGRSPTNEPGLVFARRSDYTNIVLVDNQLAGSLRAGYTAFRDRQLLPFDPALVDRIEVEAAERFAFLRETNRWRLADPPGFPADPELVSAFLERLRRLRIADFEKEVVTDFTVYGLAPPARRYTLRFAGNTNAVAQIDLGTNRNGRVFARRNQETAVFTIPAPSAEELPREAYELRDRVLWRIVPTNIVRLALIERGQTRTFIRNAAGEWSLPPEFKLPVNHFAIEDLVEQLAQLRADAWVPPVPSRDVLYERLGFHQVDRKLTFAAVIDQKTESFVIEFGRATPARSLYAAVTLEGHRVIFEFPLLLAQMVAEYLTPLAPASAR